ncbi:hypothetical protein DPMN_100192 [Dreissena polymorpha]|uniref:Uncharacterized protein n=1 Tax=Dreissena polymorpha TaxID=45954 RepID=A0A9D4R8F7_DREPO|nr:hypothetical protein DPMN_100192 [Dreissena polymorpha]
MLTSLLDDLNYANDIGLLASCLEPGHPAEDTTVGTFSKHHRSQGQHWKDSGHEEEHQSGRPNHHQWPATARCGVVHLPGQQGNHRWRL